MKRQILEVCSQNIDINFRYSVLVGDLNSDDEDMDSESFSDPEADWVKKNIQLA